MSGRPPVYLHVGAPKTGTTYLQEVLWRNRTTLRHARVLYPGTSLDAHFHAAMDLQGVHYQEHPDPAAAGGWQRLVDEARQWPGPVVISHELFGMVDPVTARRALTELGFGEVHIVYTARDLARQIPAVWQEDIKNRQVLGFAEFAAALAAPGPDAHYLVNLFWQLQDIPRVLATWTAGIPPERVHVVTVPPSGAPSGELWARFCRAVGIDRHGCHADLGRQFNPSMGVAETNLVRRLNIALADGIEWPTYDLLVKDYLAIAVLGGRENRIPLRLPDSEYPWVAQRAREMAAALAGARYDIIGDLAELLPSPPTAVRHPDEVSDAEILDAALDALAGLVTWPGHPRLAHAPDLPGWRRVAIRLSERNAAVMRLRLRYAATKSRLGRPRPR